MEKVINQEVVAVSKTLSICMVGRDDDYMPDFRYRIATTINFISRNLKQLHRLDEVEIIITDWGSTIPLAQTLTLLPEAFQICRFIYVPLEVIRSVQNGNDGFNTAMACNVGMRRGCGNFLMMLPSDTLISKNSLESIFRLLDKRIDLLVDVNSTYFLIKRYNIPEKMVRKLPSLEEWDRYLLLNAGNLNEYPRIFCVSGGCGALMGHHSILNKVQGIDERFDGWGYSDTDLMLRIGQTHSWFELTSLGVVSFHMDHPTYKVKKYNPHSDNMNRTVNNKDWGLGNYNFQVQAASNKNCSKNKDEIKSRLELEDKTRQDILKELGNDNVRTHLKRVIELALPFRWKLDRSEVDALYFLSWYTQYHYPSRYLEFGIKQGYTEAVVAYGCPGVEIYGIGQWEGVTYDQSPIIVAYFLNRIIGYCGYIRFINGKINTGVQRLKESFIGSFYLDLIFIRGELLETEDIAECLLSLAHGGALVVSCKSEDLFVSKWSKIEKQFPNFSYFKSSSCRAGIVLASSLKNKVYDGSRNDNCYFPKKWIWFLVMKYMLLKISKGLCKINKYPKYVGRICGFIKYKFLNSGCFCLY